MMGLQSLVLLLCAVRGAEPENASLALVRSAPLPQRLAAGRRQLSDQYAKLAASDGASYDLFGISMAIDGDTVVVGAYLDDDAGSASGSAYVFRTSDGGATYGQVAKLTAADAAAGDYFGGSVAIDGDTVVIGATIGARDNNGDRGAVYVFRTTDSGATYGQVAKLTASDAATGDSFGHSVAITGDTVVVGTYLKEAVYVFLSTDGGASYGQVAKLTASDAAAGDNFGISVAIDGDTIVVGSPYDDDACPDNMYCNSGSAYVFRTNDGGATYGQLAKLTASDAAANDKFGYSVAIGGDTVVVGASGVYDSRGAAYVFTPPAPTAQPTPRADTQTGSSSQKSNEDDVADDDKMMTLVVLAGLLGLSLVAGLLLFALHQQQLAAKKSRAPRTSTVTAVEPRAPRKFTVTAVEPRAPHTFKVTAVQPSAPRKFTVTAVQSV